MHGSAYINVSYKVIILIYKVLFCYIFSKIRLGVVTELRLVSVAEPPKYGRTKYDFFR
jgi:hypothetical protein